MDFLHHEMGISVVVSTFRRPYLALSLIRQLQGQTNIECPVELLIVSDGDTDELVEFLSAQTRGSRWPVRLFNTMMHDTYGLTLCRNIGIKFAKYSRLVFLDDDVSIGADFLSHYANAPDQLCLGNIQSVYVDDGRLVFTHDERGELLRGQARELEDWRNHLGFLWGGNFSVPTRFAMAVGGVDLSFIGEGEEDMDFGARLMSFLSGAFVVPEAVALHHGLVRTRANAADIEKRTSRAEQRFKDRRSLIVNDGMGYWKNTDWEQYVR